MTKWPVSCMTGTQGAFVVVLGYGLLLLFLHLVWPQVVTSYGAVILGEL